MKRFFNFLLLCFLMLLIPMRVEASENWGVFILSESHWGVSDGVKDYFIQDNSIPSVIKKENYFGVSGGSIDETNWTLGNNRTTLEDTLFHINQKNFDKILVVYFTGSSCGRDDITLNECVQGLKDVYKLFQEKNAAEGDKYLFCIMETPSNVLLKTPDYVNTERAFAAENDIPIYSPSLLNGAYKDENGKRILRADGAYIWQSDNVKYPNNGFYRYADFPQGDGIHYAYRHYWIEFTNAVRYFKEVLGGKSNTQNVQVNTPIEVDSVEGGRYLMYEAKGCYNGKGGIDPLIGSFYTACARLGVFDYKDIPNNKTKISNRNDSTGPKLALQYADGVIGDIVWASNYERLFKKTGQFPNCTSLANFWKTSTYLKLSDLNTFRKACEELSPSFFSKLSMSIPNINTAKGFVDEIKRYNESITKKKAQIIIRVDNGTTEDIERYNYFLVNEIDANGVITAQCYDNLTNPVYIFNTSSDLKNCGITGMVILNAKDCTPSNNGFRLSGLNSIGSLPCYPIRDNFYLGIEDEPVVENKEEPKGNFSLVKTGTSQYGNFTVTYVTANIPGYKGQADFVVASDLHIIKDSNASWDARNGTFGGEDRVAYLQTIKSYATERGLNTFLLGDIVDNATRANYDAIKPVLSGWNGMTWVMADHDWLYDLTQSLGGGTPASDSLPGMQRGVSSTSIGGFKILTIGSSNGEITTNASGLFSDGTPTCILTHVPMDVKGTSEYTAILHKNPYNWTYDGSSRWKLNSSPNMKSFNDLLTKDNSCYFSVAGHTHQDTVIYQNGNHAQLLLAPAFTKQFVVLQIRGV